MALAQALLATAIKFVGIKFVGIDVIYHRQQINKPWV